MRDLADSIEVTDSAGLKPTRLFNSSAQLCVPVTSQTVRCPERPTAIKRIAAFLNDRKDGASNIHTGLPVTIDGSSGEDRYVSGSSPFLSRVTFAGGSGEDTSTYMLAAFRETELARTIPDAYEAVDVRREVYDVLYPLWPERGLFTEIDRTAEASA